MLLASMKYVCFLLTTLLFASCVSAACNKQKRIDFRREEKVFYNCTGGTVDDINSIPDNAKIIVIENMEIRRINSTLFDRFANTLETLTFDNCGLTGISDDAFRKMRSLKNLELNGNILAQLNAKWPKNAKSLQSLKISDSFINRIDEDAFKTTRLLRLSFNNNNLTIVKAAWFQRSFELLSLNLGNNKIDRIEVGAFDKLKKLKVLYLHNNRLKSVRAEWLRNKNHLEYIFLHDNLISSIEKNSFKSLMNVYFIGLSNNHLKEVKSEWFGDNPFLELRYLGFRGNRIHHIDEGLVSRLSKNLEYLDISQTEMNGLNLQKIVSKLKPNTEVKIACNHSIDCNVQLRKLAGRKQVELIWDKVNC